MSLLGGIDMGQLLPISVNTIVGDSRDRTGSGENSPRTSHRFNVSDRITR